MEKNSEIVLTIESLSGDGKTVAHHEGLVFFVEDAVPGDIVKAKIWKLKKNYAEARAVEILTPSPHRIEAKCKHFGTCGGCRWQSLAYEAQLQFKHKNIVDVFKRIGGFENLDVRPVIGCEPPYFYRNKMEFTFSNERWLTSEEMEHKDEIKREVAVGLHIPERYDKVLNVEECYLQSETSTRILNTVREICQLWEMNAYSTKTHTGYLRHLVIREAKHTGERMINLVTTNDWQEAMQKMTTLLLKEFPDTTTIVNNITERKSMVAFGDKEKVYYGNGYITEKIGTYTFHISANSFFQTNTLQTEKLYSIAKEFVALQPTDVVYDLYSGTGTIALFLSDACERVVGIEVVESAIADAQRNAELNKVVNCFFLKGNLTEGLYSKKDEEQTKAGWLHEHPKPNVVVLDPPRSGVHPKVIDQIIRLKPERIVYVSCNPSTQARDAKMLADGGFSLDVIQPVDMFPHTDHIETVARFTCAK
ncbi:MAG: 23S rRNA (uracil(1939)-C(5))-methyltransferase RlmD [Ignavibacteriae bacterium]|nr:23S rRNA (uracil(1939)-C(5))-methyltransferase RlmD [Ignavibacteriota bacterium]